MTRPGDRLAGKIAIVTGRARGIGAAIAELFVLEGAAVVIGDINDELGAQTAAELGKEHGRCVFVHLDVRRTDDWEHAVSVAAERFGAPNVLVSNAFGHVGGSVLDVRFDEWQDAFDVCVNGAFHGIRAVLPGMRAQRSGSIIGISSTAGGDVGAPDFAAYQVAKAGLTALMRHVGGTYARDGVRANAIHPGPIRTPRHVEHGYADAAERWAKTYPVGRIGEPEEIAWGAVFLASDESRFMTATKINIDGGSTGFVSSVTRG